MQPGQRLVTVLVTLSVPDAADAGDATALLAVTADSTALTVVHTNGRLALPSPRFADR